MMFAEMMANGMRFPVFAGEAHATTAVHLVFDTTLLSTVIPAQAGIHF